MKIKYSNLIFFTPCLAWFLFMTYGFFLSKNFFYIKTIEIQKINIYITLIFFFLIGLFNYRKNIIKIADDINFFQHRKLFYFFILLCLFIIIFHLLCLPLDYFLNIFKGDITLDKNEINKLLNIPKIFKYIINWLANIFFPLVLVLLYNKRRNLFYIIFIVILTYYLLTQNEFAIIFNIVIFLFFFLIRQKKYLKYYYILALIFLLSATGHSYYYFNKVMNNVTINTSNITSDTPAINMSKRPDTLESRSKEDFFFSKYYRYIFIPPDVSEKWYRYKYYNFKKKNYHLKKLMPENDGSGSLSREIGNWYYNKKNNKKWTTNNNSNASFDADLNLRFGFYGFIIGLIIISLYMILTIKFYKKNIQNDIVLSIFLASFCLLPSWSLQSYFFSQGFILIPLIFFLNKKEKNADY